MNGILHAHSGLRYVVLLLLLFAIAKAFQKKGSNAEYTPSDKKLNLFAMISVHIQALLGLILYFGKGWHTRFSDMSNEMVRFFAVEHIFGMLLALVVITIGRKKAEKATENAQKFKNIATFYTVGLVIIFMSIPWPFLKDFATKYF